MKIKITENTINEGFFVDLEIGLLDKIEKVSFATIDEVISYVKERISETYKSKETNKN